MATQAKSSGGSVALIFDTHAIFWLTTGNQKFSAAVADALGSEGTALYISAVTAWEYSDLVMRNRLPAAPAIFEVIRDYAFTLLDFPATAWTLATLLPDIHRDPIDRMLVAHAISADLTLVTADSDIRRYPVKSLW
jgi:PIN domain nuclease of toxin-antitoxin system